jgi:hypothetical protein
MVNPDLKYGRFGLSMFLYYSAFLSREQAAKQTVGLCDYILFCHLQMKFIMSTVYPEGEWNRLLENPRRQ